MSPASYPATPTRPPTPTPSHAPPRLQPPPLHPPLPQLLRSAYLFDFLPVSVHVAGLLIIDVLGPPALGMDHPRTSALQSLRVDARHGHGGGRAELLDTVVPRYVEFIVDVADVVELRCVCVWERERAYGGMRPKRGGGTGCGEVLCGYEKYACACSPGGDGIVVRGRAGGVWPPLEGAFRTRRFRPAPLSAGGTYVVAMLSITRAGLSEK